MNNGQFKTGNKPWNTGISVHLSPATEFKKGQNTGSGHPRWTGDRPGYAAVHRWISHKLGKPKKCDDCSTTKAKRFEWSNISGQYKRDLSDWRRLCTPCHHRRDNIKARSWATRKAKQCA